MGQWLTNLENYPPYRVFGSVRLAFSLVHLPVADVNGFCEARCQCTQAPTSPDLHWMDPIAQDNPCCDVGQCALPKCWWCVPIQHGALAMGDAHHESANLRGLPQKENKTPLPRARTLFCHQPNLSDSDQEPLCLGASAHTQFTLEVFAAPASKAQWTIRGAPRVSETERALPLSRVCGMREANPDMMLATSRSFYCFGR